MKKFDLEKALMGKPVKLRNGQKAIIYYCTPAEIKFDETTPDTFPLKGMVFDNKGYLDDSSVTWRCNGRFRYSEDDWDIIGMWEEPKISIEYLPKSFKPKSGDKYYYINEDGISIVRCYDEDDDSDVGMAENAQCYRTKEDAQKWLDFMKSMME